MASPQRLQRVTSVLTKEIAKILSRESIVSGATLVTVTGADVSPDFLHATVHISTYPHERASTVVAELEKHTRALQQYLNKRLRMRPVPKIRFVVDRSGAEAEKIEKALKGMERM